LIIFFLSFLGYFSFLFHLLFVSFVILLQYFLLHHHLLFLLQAFSFFFTTSLHLLPLLVAPSFSYACQTKYVIAHFIITIIILVLKTRVKAKSRKEKENKIERNQKIFFWKKTN